MMEFIHILVWISIINSQSDQSVAHPLAKKVDTNTLPSRQSWFPFSSSYSVIETPIDSPIPNVDLVPVQPNGKRRPNIYPMVSVAGSQSLPSDVELISTIDSSENGHPIPFQFLPNDNRESISSAEAQLIPMYHHGAFRPRPPVYHYPWPLPTIPPDVEILPHIPSRIPLKPIRPSKPHRPLRPYCPSIPHPPHRPWYPPAIPLYKSAAQPKSAALSNKSNEFCFCYQHSPLASTANVSITDPKPVSSTELLSSMRDTQIQIDPMQDLLSQFSEWTLRGPENQHMGDCLCHIYEEDFQSSTSYGNVNVFLINSEKESSDEEISYNEVDIWKRSQLQTHDPSHSDEDKEILADGEVNKNARSQPEENTDDDSTSLRASKALVASDSSTSTTIEKNNTDLQSGYTTKIESDVNLKSLLNESNIDTDVPYFSTTIKNDQPNEPYGNESELSEDSGVPTSTTIENILVEYEDVNTDTQTNDTVYESTSTPKLEYIQDSLSTGIDVTTPSEGKLENNDDQVNEDWTSKIEHEEGTARNAKSRSAYEDKYNWLKKYIKNIYEEIILKRWLQRQKPAVVPAFPISHKDISIASKPVTNMYGAVPRSVQQYYDENSAFRYFQVAQPMALNEAIEDANYEYNSRELVQVFPYTDGTSNVYYE